MKSVNYNLISPFSAFRCVLCRSFGSLLLFVFILNVSICCTIVVGADTVVRNILCPVIPLGFLFFRRPYASSFVRSFVCWLVRSFSRILYHFVLIFFSVDACTLALGRTLIIFYICVASSACDVLFSLRILRTSNNSELYLVRKAIFARFAYKNAPCCSYLNELER